MAKPLDGCFRSNQPQGPQGRRLAQSAITLGFLYASATRNDMESEWTPYRWAKCP